MGDRSVRLDRTIGRGYNDPGSWWILVEPEVHFVRDQVVAVPNLAGWRCERMPQIPAGHRFDVMPDWICAILSPATASKDRHLKLSLYAHYGVAHVWLVDPLEHLLEFYALEARAWLAVLQASGTERVQSSLFIELMLNLESVWV